MGVGNLVKGVDLAAMQHAGSYPIFCMFLACSLNVPFSFWTFISKITDEGLPFFPSNL